MIQGLHVRFNLMDDDRLKGSSVQK